MKTKIATLLTVLPMWLCAQQNALFETTIWFTDAMGNTDSVVVGYDPDAEWESLNPQFGEVLIDAPFDSVFEVRASFDNGWHLAANKLFTKKKITRARERDWIPYPCLSISPLGIHIYARHYPVTVTWDREIFQTQCQTRSFLASHTTDGHMEGWFFNIPGILEYTQCMAEDSTYTVNGTDDPWEWYNRYATTLTNDSSAETSVLQLRFLDASAFGGTVSPCPVIVSVDQVPKEHALQVFPNPASEGVRVAMSEGASFTEDLQVRLYSATFQEVRQHTWSASSPYLDLSLAGVPPGLYFIEVRDRTGRLVHVQKLVVK
jgi:hypothetical protein